MGETERRRHELIAGNIEGGPVRRRQGRQDIGYVRARIEGIVEGEERERRRHEPRGGPLRMLVGLALGAWLIFGAGVAVGQCSAIAAHGVEVPR
jgi:hypothetical protein